MDIHESSGGAITLFDRNGPTIPGVEAAPAKPMAPPAAAAAAAAMPSAE